MIITGKSMNCCWHITFSPWTEPGTSGAAHDAGKGGHPEMPVWQEVPGEVHGTYNGNRHRYLIWKTQYHIDFMFWNIIYIYMFLSGIYLKTIWRMGIYIYIYYTYIYIYIYMECRWQLEYSGNIYLENHNGHITSGWFMGRWPCIGLITIPTRWLLGYPLLIKQGNRRSFLSFIY